MLGERLLLLVFIGCTFGYHRLRDDPKSPGYPVVLVPGDAGTRLEANLTGKPEVVHYICYKTTPDFFTLWLNLKLMTPIEIDCWVDNMKLVFNSSTVTSSNMPGVDIRIPGFGLTEEMEWLDPSKSAQGRYFYDLVEMLTKFGYHSGKNIMGAPYDWRRAPNELTEFYDMLKTMIETTYRYNNNTKVVVISHSMGSPIMLYFYNSYVPKSWKTKFLKSHISLAGAWGGAIQIVRLFASGYNMNHYRIVLPPSKLRVMQRSFLSSAFLYPSYNIWNNSEVLASTYLKNYTVADVEEFFNDMNYTDGWVQYKAAGRLLGKLEAPEVEVHCIYGSDIDTPEYFQWSKGSFPDYPPKVKFGNGDGTVNLRSLEACGKWLNKNGGKTVTMHELKKAEHMSIMQDSRALDLIKKILYDEPL